MGRSLLTALGILAIITLFTIPYVLSRRIFPSSRAALLGNKIMMSSTTVGDARNNDNDPMVAQPYQLLKKTKLSPDSYLLHYAILGRSILGKDPMIPTCIKVDYSGDGVNQGKTLSKSYSPITHPQTEGSFDLIVKSYPIQPGGGLGKYLCDMHVGDTITATLKKERMMHGSPIVEGRWKHVGLIAGGTGIAPLLQLARILLDSPHNETTVHLLFINRHEDDILGKSIIDQMAIDHPTQFFVTYSLTDSENDTQYEAGRGTIDMARRALPPPFSGEGESDTMIFVCGKDGFVAHWGGPVGRAPPKPDGSKGPKIQGPLQGVLKLAGYSAEQVFKY